MAGSSEGPFRFVHPVEVRFRDVDVGGHVHHSLVLVFFEEARAAYWRHVVDREHVGDIDYILAEATVRYHERIFWPDRLEVAVRTSLLERKHFVMEYEIRSGEGDRLASGRSTQVMYDYDEGSSRPIPPTVRSRIEGFEEGLS